MTTKLHFKKVRAKNFRSFGAQFIEIDLTTPKTLVCSSDNGAGKSTGLTHALTFVLFDKAYQKGQKKTSLINSKNNKDCIVEVEFDTKGSEWLVRRGIKPNLFEVIKDGKPLEPPAGKDMQTYLTETILGMDDKVFFNTVVLGRDKFVPFNEMSASDNRNFVEVLLDLGVFSKMNEITKEDIKEVTRQITDNNYAIGKTDTAISAGLRVIDALQGAIASKQADNAGLVAAAEVELQEIMRNAVVAKKDLEAVDAELAKFPDGFEATVSKMGTLLTTLNGKKNMLTGQRDKFMSMTTCPTCEQEVSEHRKGEVCTKLNPDIDKAGADINKLDPMFKEAVVKVEKLRELNTKRRIASDNLHRLQHVDFVTAKRRITELQAVGDASEEQKKVADELHAVSELRRRLVEEKQAETNLLKKKADLTALLTFLKDDGVKSEIAKIYIPVLNQKVNAFLDALNLWVNIVIDEEFNMTMVAPDRKGQSISDLSTGQMRRIDLAMLLAWRDVAQMKSSVDTNLLIFDETLENLSAQGVADFIEFFEQTYQDNLNLFVISQRRDEFSEYFDNVIEFALRDDFSYIL